MPQAIHIVPGLDPSDGGPTYSVPRLGLALRKTGYDARILTVESANTLRQDDVQSFPQSAHNVPVLGSMRVSAALRDAAYQAARACQIVHAHGLWLMPNVYAGSAAAKVGTPLVVSPRGMLATEALRFSRFKKSLFWTLLQGRAYARAAAWHATSDGEADEIRAFGIRAPVAVIPNGIDIPPVIAQHTPAKPRRTLLFLSRLHPKKGLPNLIAAWSRLAPERPSWDLVIAGQDEGSHRAELEALVAASAVPNVTFTGPIYGAQKQALLRDADLFVLPTRSENFGIAVAEALAYGVPAVVTTGAPWSGLHSEGCGWWIGQGVSPLVAALAEATALPPADRQAMGLRGRAWMERDFGWDAIGAQMAEVYRWLHDGGPPPRCVNTD